MKRVTLGFLSILSFACGDSDSPEDPAAGGAGSPATGSGGATTTAAGPTSGPSTSSGGVADSINCGATSCAAPEVCCVDIGTGMGACEGSCQGNAATFACDGPEDCGGNACCGTLTDGYACAAGEMCSSGVPRCHGEADCPNEDDQCLPATFGDVQIDSCAML